MSPKTRDLSRLEREEGMLGKEHRGAFIVMRKYKETRSDISENS